MWVNGLDQYNKVSRQVVTSSTISYTCTFVDIDTHVTVNRYSGKADLHYGDDYLNSHEGQCKFVAAIPNASPNAIVGAYLHSHRSALFYKWDYPAAFHLGSKHKCFLIWVWFYQYQS